MKVIIRKCNNNSLWHSNFIGQVVEVISMTNSHYHIYSSFGILQVSILDCDVVLSVNHFEDRRYVKVESKPPLGLVPANIVYKQRMKDLLKAIERYIEADVTVPDEWIKELSELSILVEEL